MLVYKPESDGSSSFAGDIDFGGRSAGTEYEVITAADKVWIKGTACKGYGTGVCMYYSDWYHVTEDGAYLALSYPCNAYENTPYGAYSVCMSYARKYRSSYSESHDPLCIARRMMGPPPRLVTYYHPRQAEKHLAAGSSETI